MCFKYRLKKFHYSQWIDYCYKHDDALQKKLRGFSFSISFAIIAFGLMNFFTMINVNIIFKTIVLSVYVIIACYMYKAIPKRMKANELTALDANPYSYIPMCIILSDDGLELKKSGITTFYEYSEIDNLHNDLSQMYIYTRNKTCIIVPFSVFQDEGEKNEFISSIMTNSSITSGN